MNVSGEIVDRARRLRIAAAVLEVVAVLGSTAVAISGVAMFSHIRMVSNEKTHPPLPSGLAVIVSAVLVGLFFWCVAHAIGTYAIDVGARQNVDVTERHELPEFLRRHPTTDVSR
jgi:NO-binding membrane sensor protein with MHYT domain